MRLSLAMIVKDEAADLPRCLASVRGLVDEAVVVDTGSKDGTPELAARLGAKVLHHPWGDDFAQARNASLRACTGDGVLVLDADETVDAADHPTIRRALEEAAAPAWALEIRNHLPSGAFLGPTGPPRRDDGRYPLPAACSHYWPQRTLRLFRASGEVYTGRVHEQAEPWFRARGLEIRALDAVIHHFGKLEPARDRAKQARYLELARREAAEHPGDRSAQYDLLQQALLAGDWEAALAAARACAGPDAPLAVSLGAATALRHLGRAHEALDLLAGEDAARDHARGRCLEALGRSEEAQEAYLAALEADPGFTLPFLDLVKLLEGQGRGADARRVLEAGLDQNPRDLNLWTALVSLSARGGDLGLAARDAWDALRVLPGGGQGLWHQLVAQALRLQGHQERAREVVAQGLAVFPGHPDLERLRN